MGMFREAGDLQEQILKLKDRVLHLESVSMNEAMRRAAYKIAEEIDEHIKKYIDPYLQPGWPCEVFASNGSGSKELVYYNKDGKFVAWSGNVGKDDQGEPAEHYRPIGTEWDFAPNWAERMVISSYGGVCFGAATASEKVGITSVLPEKYYGRTIHRPEWAKE